MPKRKPEKPSGSAAKIYSGKGPRWFIEDILPKMHEEGGAERVLVPKVTDPEPMIREIDPDEFLNRDPKDGPLIMATAPMHQPARRAIKGDVTDPEQVAQLQFAPEIQEKADAMRRKQEAEAAARKKAEEEATGARVQEGLKEQRERERMLEDIDLGTGKPKVKPEKKGETEPIVVAEGGPTHRLVVPNVGEIAKGTKQEMLDLKKQKATGGSVQKIPIKIGEAEFEPLEPPIQLAQLGVRTDVPVFEADDTPPADLGPDYQNRIQGRSAENDARETELWGQTFKSTEGLPPTQIEPIAPKTGPEGRELPEPKPSRRPTEDPLGLQPGGESGIRTVGRHVKEAFTQIPAGMADAVINASNVFTPLTEWFNENIVDIHVPVPRPDAPQTVTGNISRKISEFLTGFIPALRALRGTGAVTGAATAPMAAGAISDFLVHDPHEGRLADLWKEAKLPNDILINYLASDPNDTELESRFKNSLEGAGLGLATEGIFLAARAIRAARAVRKLHTNEVDYYRAKYGEITDDALKNLGNPKGSSVRVIQGKLEGDEINLAPRAFLRKHGAELPEGFEVSINWARIDEPDQIKFVIGKMAEAGKGTIDEARRGVQTQEMTEKLAKDMGLSVGELLTRRKGAALNAEQALAARQLWLASGEKLLELAKAAADPNAGPVDMFIFRKQMATHAAIQSEVLGARAEAGRALASWRIPATGAERARAIEQTLAALGGVSNSKEMARRLAILAIHGDVGPASLGKLAFKGYTAASIDAFREFWVNMLLSSPTTHFVNTLSNTLVPFQQIMERAVAGVGRGIVGGEGARLGEAVAMTYGMTMALRDAWRMGLKSLKTGETSLGFNKTELVRPRAISAEGFGMASQTGFGRALDFMGNVFRIPGRLLGAEDEFFKTIGYRMEVHAQALRQASGEGLKGRELGARIAELVKNPPEHIHLAAADAALINTFTSEVGTWGRAVIGLRDAGQYNPMFLVLPFVRTPVNLARYAFERTPLAPFSKQWRADIGAGGARSDLALAKMATGTAMMMTVMDYADLGMISGKGPKDKETREALKRQGWKEYSFKVGDTWYSYNRVDPMGMVMGFASSITEAIKDGEINEDDVDEWNEVAAMSIAVVSQTVINKTYMEGFANFVEAMDDPHRHSEHWVQNLTASLVPSASNALKNVMDPLAREANSPAEAVMARIAFLSERLPPRRDLWGAPLTLQQHEERGAVGTVYDALTPVRSAKQVESPIDREIVRLGEGIERIAKKSTFSGVQVNFKEWPEVYDEYVRLAGNELKHPGWQMGAKDYLNLVVEGKHSMGPVYKILPDASRQAFIQSMIGDYRKLAQYKILSDPRFKEFAAYVKRLQENYRGGRMPVLGETQ